MKVSNHNGSDHGAKRGIEAYARLPSARSCYLKRQVALGALLRDEHYIVLNENCNPAQGVFRQDVGNALAFLSRQPRIAVSRQRRDRFANPAEQRLAGLTAADKRSAFEAVSVNDVKFQPAYKYSCGD